MNQKPIGVGNKPSLKRGGIGEVSRRSMHERQKKPRNMQ